MITVAAAQALIKNTIFKPKLTETILLSESVGRVLASPVISPIHMPPFPQSAMDGYAVNYNDEILTYSCIDESAAGTSRAVDLKPGEAVRIFTGAMVPDSANMVIRQEDAVLENKGVNFKAVPKLGANIRPRSEQIKAGEVALNQGQVLNIGAIGFLSSLGIIEVDVVVMPQLAIVTTGNELVPPGQDLKPGEIYESNGKMLSALCAELKLKTVDVFHVKDDYDATLKMVGQVIDRYDIVLFSGGISVGDYDFVGKALEENGVETIFYKIKQKPGKPLYFGRKAETAVFALPGNPAAALTCFYIYVLPIINRFAGKEGNGLVHGQGILAEGYTKKGNRAVFLKAKRENNGLKILDGQSSAMLQAYALADALVYIPEDQFDLEAGDTVMYYQL